MIDTTCMEQTKKMAFVADPLNRKIQRLNELGQKTMVLTWSRASTISPAMLGHTIGVYNGREHIPLAINDLMIGWKLGEFIETRTFRSHSKIDKKAKR